MNTLTAHNKRPVLQARKIYTSDIPSTLKETIKLIGKAIRDGSHYMPIRNHAAALASRAAPKDYLGQVQHIWKDFVKRWRYVNDPLGTETVAVSGPAIHGLIMGTHVPQGRGYGDCDDASVAIGAMLTGIGREVRIATSANRKTRPGSIFSHVYVQAKIPRLGWITVDPVVYPVHGLGYTSPQTRVAYWDLFGRLLGTRGNFPPQFQQMLGGVESEDHMEGYQGFQDIGLESVYGPLGSGEPEDWAVHGLQGFGAHVPSMGVINGEKVPGILVEVDDEDTMYVDGFGEVVRTPMLEMDPVDYAHIARHGVPRPGAVALSDEGAVYQWVPDQYGGLGGFFKKLFRKIKKGVKKVARKIKKGVKKVVKGIGKGIKKLVSKLPGGKWLVKMYGKIKKVAMKIVKPLMKLVGPIAKKLAPIAAMIPGYGPAIAGALHTAGKIAKVLKATGVVTDSKGRPKFKSDKHAKIFRARLKAEAERMKKRRAMKKRRRPGRPGRTAPVRMMVGRPQFARSKLPRGFHPGAWQRAAAIARLQRRAAAARRRQGIQPKIIRPARIFRPGTPEHHKLLRGLGAVIDDR